ncbi:MAG: malonyl-ACP O-methyltransferase BioC [Gammaproteobacteria bacterium]|nr:malonyl-ACP O-methyltransferase BioC [Gammaproteobacteria bacterium]
MNQQTKQTEFETEQKIDQARVRRAFDRAAKNYEQFAVMQNEVCKRLLEKLEIVKISPRYILDAGTGTGSAIPALFKRYKKAQLVALDLSENMLEQSRRHGSFFRAPHLVCADIEQLPFADNVFDLVFSNLSMQWCNDLNAVFLEAKRVLKPGGLFVFTTFGPDTLKELRSSWAAADKSNHVNRFIDMHDIGDALLHDGFAEPVMEAEVLTLTYDSADEVMRDLKAIGANVKSGRSGTGVVRSGLGGKALLQAVRDNYEQFRQDNLLPASYEIIYGHAWKPVNDKRKQEASNQQLVDFQP